MRIDTRHIYISPIPGWLLLFHHYFKILWIKNYANKLQSTWRQQLLNVAFMNRAKLSRCSIHMFCPGVVSNTVMYHTVSFQTECLWQMGVWANIKLTWFVVSGVVYHTCALSFYRYRCFVSIGWYPRIHLGHRTLPRRLLVFWHPVQVIQFRRKNKQSILIRILHDYFKIISP